MTEDQPRPFTEHLRELRNRLIITVLAVTAGFFICWFFREALFNLVSGPILEAMAANGIFHLTAIEISETMFVYMKLALVAGIVLTCPVIFYQLWAFVAPGLHPHEKRYVRPIVLFSVLFFVLGVTFCYRVVLPFVTDFLVALSTSNPEIGLQVTVDNAFSFALMALLIFGAVFELPLLLFFLSLLGLVTARQLMRYFKYWVVAAFVIGAIFTPPEPVSQTMMAVPLVVLYLIGALLAAFAGRRRERRGGLPPRAWALTGLVLLLFAGGIFVSSWLLGQKQRLADVVPTDVRWLAGLRPAALLGQTPLDQTGQIRRQPDVSVCATSTQPAPLAAILAKLVPPETTPPGECLLFEQTNGARAAICDMGDEARAEDAARELAPQGAFESEQDGATIWQTSARQGWATAWRTPGWLFWGQRAAVSRAIAGSAGGPVLADDPDRLAAVDHLRRSSVAWLQADKPGSGWSVLWPPDDAGRPPQAVIAMWSDHDPPTLRLSLRYVTAASASQVAGQADDWRERQITESQQIAAERQAIAQLQQQLAWFDRLTSIVEKSLTLQATSEQTTPVVIQAAADLKVLRSELTEHQRVLSNSSNRSAVSMRPGPSFLERLGVAGMERIRAHADGPSVNLELVLRCNGIQTVIGDLGKAWQAGRKELP